MWVSQFMSVRLCMFTSFVLQVKNSFRPKCALRRLFYYCYNTHRDTHTQSPKNTLTTWHSIGRQGNSPAAMFHVSPSPSLPLSLSRPLWSAVIPLNKRIQISLNLVQKYQNAIVVMTLSLLAHTYTHIALCAVGGNLAVTLRPLLVPSWVPPCAHQNRSVCSLLQSRYEGFPVSSHSVSTYIGNCFYFGPFIRFTFQVAQICLACVRQRVWACVRVCVWGRRIFSSIDRYHL